jgi:ATP-dependent DNA helicase RecG
MDQALLERFFREPEGERVERKRNASDLDDIREVIAAFANDLANRREPSVVLVGVENDGSCSNLAISDRLLRDLAGLRVDGKLIPFPVISVDQATVDHCTFAFVAVEPTDNPPVRFDGRIFVRVGPTTRLATPAEELRLVEKRRWGNLPFDGQPAVGATLNDIDLRRFEVELRPAWSPRKRLRPTAAQSRSN